MSFSDFFDAFLAYKLANDLSEINKRDKKLKMLKARSAELQRIGYALIEEHNRLSEIGDVDGINKLEKQIAEVNAQVVELRAEFKKFRAEE